MWDVLGSDLGLTGNFPQLVQTHVGSFNVKSSELLTMLLNKP